MREKGSKKKNNELQGFTKKIKPSKIFIPIIIGMSVAAWLLYDEFDSKVFASINWKIESLFWLLCAVVCMFLRDFYYIVRVRLLSSKELTWRKAFNVVMLWEFTSAITPSAIGGTSVAILFVNKEGVRLGKSSAIVMLTSFLDEVFFIVTFPLLLLLLSYSELFTIVTAEGLATSKLLFIAILGYALKVAYTLVIAYGLFINPRGLKWFLLFTFRLPFLKRWRMKMNTIGSDMIAASNEFKKQKFSFWFKAFYTTFISWIARYWVVNFLIIALFGIHALSLHEHLLVFGRQFIMWIMMLVSPTPGGSGFAEYVFMHYLQEFIPLGFAATLAVLWRLITYYPYLFIGAVMVPRWIKRVTAQKSKR